VTPLAAAFITRLEAWAQPIDDIRLILLLGSQARADDPADAFSDVDVVLVSRDHSRYLDDAGWLAEIGTPILTFREATATGGELERRVLFSSSLDVDFSVIGLATASGWTGDGLPVDVLPVLRRGMRISWHQPTARGRASPNRGTESTSGSPTNAISPGGGPRITISLKADLLSAGRRSRCDRPIRQYMHQQPPTAPLSPNNSSSAGQRPGVSGRIANAEPSGSRSTVPFAIGQAQTYFDFPRDFAARVRAALRAAAERSAAPLVRAALRAAAERPAAPLVATALRAAAERSAAVRREAAPFAWRDSELRETVLRGSFFKVAFTAPATRGRRTVFRRPCPAS